MRDNDSFFFQVVYPFWICLGGIIWSKVGRNDPCSNFPWSFHSSPLENDGWIWSVYVCLRFTPASFCSGSMLSFRGVYGEGQTASRLSSFFCSQKFVSKLLMFTPPPSPLRPIYKSLSFFFWGGGWLKRHKTTIVKREPMLDLKFDGCGVCGVF